MKRNRVVKKLVRVQAISDDAPSTEPIVEATTRKVRRRLRVKKKKKRLLKDPTTENSIYQVTKPRRKLVVTRKRLLPHSSQSQPVTTSSMIIEPPEATTIEDTINNQKETTDLNDVADEDNVIDHTEYSAEEITTDAADDETTTDAMFLDDIETYEITTFGKGDLFSNDLDDSTEYESEETKLEEYENATEENLIDDSDSEDGSSDTTDEPNFQHIPEYEPFFPELSASLDAPVLLLKTTVVSSVDLITRTVVQSRLRTYTFIVTRVHGTEQIVTSTTEVKPQIKTSTLTEPHTSYTTLTLLDFDATQTLTDLQKTIIPTSDNHPPPDLLNQDNAGRGYEEARYNLATRIMSNGVEVIVAGDKTTRPGEPDFKRVLPSTVQKPVTLKPSTLTDHMVMMLPQDASNMQTLTSSMYPSQFVTKTCVTTFTYLTTYLEGSTTTVSSHEQVVSNVATEERNTGKILPTPTIGITLTQYPNLSVGVFHTTYTYLNTILDGEQPLVVSSKHTVTNTVTAPDDYLSLLKPSETVSAIKDTNTYYSTIALEKTLYEGNESSVVSTREVVTQVVITESVPPRPTSVMTSYIALDMEEPSQASAPAYTTTDVVKTYFVTYTYYNTLIENDTPVVNTNISTSSDVVTEKLYLYPKKTNNVIVNTTPVKDDKKKHKVDLSGENFHILATKAYFTTFTYFTTMLQEENLQTPTIISSRTRVVENLVTETIDPNLLDKKYLNIIRNEIKEGSNSITKMATLQGGQKLEITAIANEATDKIKPTKVLPIEKTQMPEATIISDKTVKASSPSVITGSTIIFVDDDPFAQLAATPILTSKSSTVIRNSLGSLLSSEIVQTGKVSTATTKSKRSTKTKAKTQSNAIRATKTKSPNPQGTSTKTEAPGKLQNQNNKNKQSTATKIAKPIAPASDLLGLGSININSLQALTPVLNAMAGLITTNLKSNRRNDANVTTTTTQRPLLRQKADKPFIPASDTQNRSPIYIPVGGLADDFEIAESQNIATFDWIDPPPKDQVPGKTAHEAPLLNGGIPISPGEVITANSDVIVGRPGRIGPRIPHIPLNQVKPDDNIPIGMNPPPVQNKIWPKNNRATASNIRNDKPLPNIIHAPNKDDYVGPPPPVQRHKETRGDKRKHIPLTASRDELRPYYESEFYNTYAQNQNSYGPNFATNEINHVANLPNLQDSIRESYDSISKHSYPVYARDHPVVPGIPINDLNIKPSVINEPITLPEVIERSTGQPLLVNIQPSQVAFVNIPFNRTTALIYGGSAEPHRNGQYFDDPSPYPEPEFSGIEFNNGVAHVPSIYSDEPSNHQQVKGVIKVDNQLINVEPYSGGHTQQVPLNINPTKPHNDVQMAMGSNHEVSVNVPPISFGLIQQGSDFNAHVINHGDMIFRPPATPYEVTSNQNSGRPGYQKIPQNFKRRPVNVQPNLDRRPNDKTPYQHNGASNPQTNDIFNDLQTGETPSVEGNIYPNKPFAPKRNILRPRPQRPDTPSPQISEYMTPPPINRITIPKRQYPRRPVNKRPLPIPLTPDSQHNKGQKTYNKRPQNIFSTPYQPHNSVYQPQITSEDKSKVNLPVYNTHNYPEGDLTSHPNADLDIGDHRDDDLANDDGEVLQESNSRPLLPGEVPFEILKAKTSTTTERASLNTIQSPSEELLPKYNEISVHKPPVVSNNARPFAANTANTVKPEYNGNQHTKHVNYDTIGLNQFSQPSGFSKHPTTEPVNAFATESYHEEYSGSHKHKNSPSGFVVVGSQFEDGGMFAVSGNQFTDVVGHVHKNRKNVNRIKETTTSKTVSTTDNSIDSVFSIKMNTPIVYKQTTTTQKPVIIYIDNVVENKDSFFHKVHNRPSVTSLPIDSQTNKPPVPHKINSSFSINTQTEKSFVPHLQNSHVSNQIDIIKEPVTTEVFVTKQSTTTLPTPELNTGEVTLPTYSNLTTELTDMVVMKPPPYIQDLPKTEMQPPKIEIDTHGGDILRVPSIKTDHPSSAKPYVPQPMEEMVPPPQTTTDEPVLGMSPPPLVSTHKPIISNKPLTTNKPVFSMEIDVPKEVPVAFKPSTTTDRYNRFTRPRKPYTRNPTYRRTTPASTTITTIKYKRPTYVFERNTSATNYKPITEKAITPSPTIKDQPSMEVIIGHPNLNIVGKPSTTPSAPLPSRNVEIIGSEKVVEEITTEKTTTLASEPTTVSSIQTGIPTISYAIETLQSSSKKDIITQAVHHAGNEVKAVDEATSTITLDTTRKLLPTLIKESKPVIPTRYITHTKTSTITITKTTVVKTLGGPPSTLTILVTKTEKSTIIDTVTEFHTLVKPTSIVETVTTTVQQGSSLYPPDAYGSVYPSIQVRPSPVTPLVKPTASLDDAEDVISEENLDDFIITETDPPITESKDDKVDDNDSILVVMTDKNTKGVIKVPNSYETQERAEVIANDKINNVLLAGILTANHQTASVRKPGTNPKDKCEPECKPSRNELCQKAEGIMRCICRPGFARMFPDRPCLPTYTYNLRITLERIGENKLHYFADLANSTTTDFFKFAQATREALDRMVMQSDLRDIFHGVQVHSFDPSPTAKGIVTRFYLQLSDNIDESRLEDIFKKYLRNNNYSLGGTDMFASSETLDELRAVDFDECSFAKFHDCSENAQCFNLKGTYTCSCREGFSDLSENILYPGRICSAEQVGCDRCNYHGTCYSREGEEVFCECFQWYAGESCHVNLKVLLIALATLGAILFALLLVCIILTCVRRKPRQAGITSGMSFLPQRVGTLDRRAMIQDTSSEDSRSETNTLPYVQQKQKKPKGALKKTSKVSIQLDRDVENGEKTISFPDQKDRSLTVMIPRAKYHPAPPTSPLINYTSFDARKPSVPSVSEAKLLSYLDAGPSPNKTDCKRKFSNAPSDSYIEEKPSSRKTSGALVSAGFEVSATVVNNMGTLGTTCGTEADRSENATLIQKISADLLSSTGTRSQFNTLRKSLVDDNLESSTNWLDLVPRVTTVSEARSYDETTIPPPMKSFRNDYDSKPSSQHPNDEANTMAERDLGSTFLLPHTHLYKPDRGSDISGFESL